MKTLCFVVLAFGSVEALAQPKVLDVEFTLRTDPPSRFLSPRFEERMGGHSSQGYPYFFTRRVLDNVKRVAFGYELLLAEQEPGTYLASFGPSSLSLLKISADPHQLMAGPSPATKWTIQPVPAMPASRVVHAGDVISVELSVDAATGAKLIDDFRKAGEVRGGTVSFASGADSIKLESTLPIAAGNAPYNLFVAHDRKWKPAAQVDEDQFAMGSVDPGEVSALKRK